MGIKEGSNQSTTKESLLHTQQEIYKQNIHCEKLNSALNLLQKYNKYAPIQREINMIREAAENSIDHIKALFN